MSEARIEDGIEWFKVGDEEDCQCARCGSSCGSIRCYECAGEGGYHGEEIERSYDFGWIDPDKWYRCHHCGGKGGWMHCLSGPEWCKANPLPGRENIESTALKPEAWEEW